MVYCFLQEDRSEFVSGDWLNTGTENWKQVEMRGVRAEYEPGVEMVRMKPGLTEGNPSTDEGGGTCNPEVCDWPEVMYGSVFGWQEDRAGEHVNGSR